MNDMIDDFLALILIIHFLFTVCKLCAHRKISNNMDQLRYLRSVSRLASFIAHQTFCSIVWKVLTFSSHLGGNIVHVNLLDDMPDGDVDEEAYELVVHH